MRHKLLLTLLLLAGCNSDSEADGPQGNAAAAGAELDVLPPPPSPAELEARARQALATAVLDPASAELANLRAGSGGSICGDVNAKGDNGRPQGFRPFVVTPENVGVVSSASEIMFNNPADMFPDFYIRYCAPPEELPALTKRMAESKPAEAGPEDNMLTPLPEPAPLPPPPLAPPPSPAPKAEAPAPQQPARRGNVEDSFFNAVVRPGEEKKD